MKLADKLLADIRTLKLEHNADAVFLLLTVTEMKQLDKELSGFYTRSLMGDGEPFSFAGVPITLVQ